MKLEGQSAVPAARSMDWWATFIYEVTHRDEVVLVDFDEDSVIEAYQASADTDREQFNAGLERSLRRTFEEYAKHRTSTSLTTILALTAHAEIIEETDVASEGLLFLCERAEILLSQDLPEELLLTPAIDVDDDEGIPKEDSERTWARTHLAVAINELHTRLFQATTEELEAHDSGFVM